jgi:hypothetical protein
MLDDSTTPRETPRDDAEDSDAEFLIERDRVTATTIAPPYTSIPPSVVGVDSSFENIYDEDDDDLYGDGGMFVNPTPAAASTSTSENNVTVVCAGIRSALCILFVQLLHLVLSCCFHIFTSLFLLLFLLCLPSLFFFLCFCSSSPFLCFALLSSLFFSFLLLLLVSSSLAHSPAYSLAGVWCFFVLVHLTHWNGTHPP